MLDVISYSHRHIDFVRHLFDQLVACERKSWIYWQDIPPTADRLAEICSLEIELAVKHDKRLALVDCKVTDTDKCPYQ